MTKEQEFVKDANRSKRILGAAILIFVLITLWFIAMNLNIWLQILFTLIVIIIAEVMFSKMFPVICSKCNQKMKFWKRDELNGFNFFNLAGYYKCPNNHILKWYGA